MSRIRGGTHVRLLWLRTLRDRFELRSDFFGFGEEIQPRAAKLGTLQKLLGADLPGVRHEGPVAQVVLIGVYGLGVEVEGGAKLEA